MLAADTHPAEDAAFFSLACQAFADASTGGCDTRQITIAGQRVKLKIAAGSRIDEATHHLSGLVSIPYLQADQGADALTILIWEVAATGVNAPAPQWRSTDHIARGELPRFSGEFFITAYNIESRVLSMFDRKQRIAIHCIQSFADLPQYERGAPLRDILGWWLNEYRTPILHASAIAAGDRGAILVGPGGSGKSSTAARCVGHQELSFLSDDYCAVGLDEGNPTIHAIFRTAKLTQNEAETHPYLHGGAFSAATEKHLFHLSVEQMHDSARLTALYAPTIVDRERSSIMPMGSGAAMRRLAPSTLFQLPGHGAGSMEMMAELVRKIPTYCLELGRDRNFLLEMLSNHLREGHA